MVFISAVTSVTLDLRVVEEFPHDAAIPSAPAKTISLIRIGKIFLGIFFIVDMWFLYWHR